jgi:hypothetical protein
MNVPQPRYAKLRTRWADVECSAASCMVKTAHRDDGLAACRLTRLVHRRHYRTSGPAPHGHGWHRPSYPCDRRRCGAGDAMMAVLHKFPAPERAAFRRRHMCGADFTAILPLSKSSMVSGKLSGQNSSLAVPRWAAVSRNRFGRCHLVKYAIIRDDQQKSRETLPLRSTSPPKNNVDHRRDARHRACPFGHGS